MAARKKKRLPKDFSRLLEADDLDALIRVFDTCEPDARDGVGGPTAVGMYECPEPLIRWLAARGADLDAADRFGATPLRRHASVGHGRIVEVLIELGATIDARDGASTPLHDAAGHHKAATVRVLVDHGADVHAADGMFRTPLASNLANCRNADIAAAAEVAGLLLAAGAPVTEDIRKEVERIGRDFEFGRPGFNPDDLEQADAGLARLYALFEVAAVPARRMHDGASAITVSAADWPGQHEELWQLLVPPQGAAPTVQGEVIRISGRVASEIAGNGGANWDGHYRQMADAMLAHLRSGAALPEPELAEATRLLAEIRAGDADHDELNRVMELAVRWVLANPAPVNLPAPAYRR